MRGSLCVVGLILLLTTLNTEGSAFRHHAKKQLKKSLIPARNLETPLGR